MPLRTRIYGSLMNCEIEEYLKHNDIIIVPVGVTEVHGGFPVDAETVLAEGIGLKMAEACDGLVLTGLPYFFPGSTVTGRATVSISVRTGIDYLMALAKSLYRQGFRRQIYTSLHMPAYLTISAVIRDFFDETGVPLVYIDAAKLQFGPCAGIFPDIFAGFHAMTAGAYKLRGRLDDVPLTTDHDYDVPSTTAAFGRMGSMAYASGGVGSFLGATTDHMPTPKFPDRETLEKWADEGIGYIEKMVAYMDVPGVAEDMRKLKAFTDDVRAKYPWVTYADAAGI